MRRITWLLTGGLLLVCLAHLQVTAQNPAAKTAQRARPPQFDPAEVNRIFFDDVFSKLQGQRPANPSAVPVAAAPNGGGTPGGGDGGGTSGFAWSNIISSTTLEDEVKAIKLNVDKNVTTPSQFAGRGHKQVRRDFSILALVFAIISDYDGEVRFKDNAPAARDAFARSAANTKAGGNTNTYNEARRRKDDLQDLLGGAALQLEAESEDTEWAATVDRSPLMQRLEKAFNGNLAGWTSSQDEFSSNIEEVLHEAEMIAAIGEVLTREGMDDAGDEDYDEFAKRMKASAQEIAAAVKLNNYDQARKHAGEIRKSCDACHEVYR